MINKYIQLESDIYSVFGSDIWKAELIKTYPSNFIPSNSGMEFIRISIVPSGKALNAIDVTGMAIIDIFTVRGAGTKRASVIADILDKYLLGKSLKTDTSTVLFLNSAMNHSGIDKDDPALYRSIYTIIFNFYGNK